MNTAEKGERERGVTQHCKVKEKLMHGHEGGGYCYNLGMKKKERRKRRKRRKKKRKGRNKKKKEASVVGEGRMTQPVLRATIPQA